MTDRTVGAQGMLQIVLAIILAILAAFRVVFGRVVFGAVVSGTVALGAVAFGAVALQAVPAAAQNAKPTATQSASAGPAISADVKRDDDARIAARIRGIFSEISALRPVTVRVSAGVVTLQGTVADADAIAQAEGIAGRVAGVVTVQNRLQRNLEVENNLNPALASVRKKALELAQLAPLVGVAVGIAVLIGSFGYFLARRRTWWSRLAPNPFLAEVIATAIRFVFVIAGVVLALDIVGATALLGAVLGGAGVVGIAVGFAVRDTIDNYVSSLMLSVRQPFRANDSVSIDGKEGRVVRLTSRATILMTPDGNHLRIPNSAVFRAVIVNFTSNPQRRFQFDLPINTHAHCGGAIAAALDAIKAQEFVLQSPEANVEIAETAGSHPLIRCFGWVDQTRTDPGKARTVAIRAVIAALRDGGFAAEEPVHRLRMETDAPQAPAASAKSSAAAPAQDVAPERHLAAMVAEERATKKDGKDLLDPSRPVE